MSMSPVERLFRIVQGADYTIDRRTFDAIIAGWEALKDDPAANEVAIRRAITLAKPRMEV